MAYHIDFETVGLEYLKIRLEREDLIPSQLVLREDLDGRLDRLSAAGITSLAKLERSLRTAKLTGELSAATGISHEYLAILGRALRGYRPAPAALGEYPGADRDLVEALAREGIADGRSLYEAAFRKKDREALARKIGRSVEELTEMVGLADLSRIQWVSPTFARLLYDSGFTSVAIVARSSPQDIHERVDALNRERKAFGGKIGLRDMGRLVFLASLLPREPEE